MKDIAINELVSHWCLMTFPVLVAKSQPEPMLTYIIIGPLETHYEGKGQELSPIENSHEFQNAILKCRPAYTAVCLQNARICFNNGLATSTQIID